MAYLELLRAGYGVCQVVKPDFLARRILRHRLDGRAATVVRILGGRHVLQAAVISAAPRSSFLHRGGAVVDLLHAMTAGFLGISDRRRRTAALTDAAVAGFFAAAELRAGSSQRD